MIKIPALNSKESLVLYYYAYAGPSAKEFMSEFRTAFKFRATEVTQIEELLKKAQLLIKEGYYFGKISINPKARLDVLSQLIRMEPMVLKQLRSIGKDGYFSINTLLINILESVLKGEIYTSTQKLLLPSEVEMFLYLSYEEPWMQKLLLYLCDEDRYRVMQSIIDSAFVNMKRLPEAFFDHCVNYTIRPVLKTKCIDMRDYYAYVVDGTWTEPIKGAGKREYLFMRQGIRAVFNQQYQDAIDWFAKANNATDKSKRDSNGPGDIFGFYYNVIACMALLQRQQLQKISLNQRYIYQMPGAVVASASLSDDLRPTQADKERMERNLNYKILEVFWSLFKRYYYSTDIGTIPAMPEYKILQFELQKYLTFSTADFNRLCEAYGKAPGLTSIKKVEKWEQNLQELIADIDRSVTTQETIENAQLEKKERIVYYIDSRMRQVVPMMQSWLKSGRWGTGRRMSAQRFFEGGYDNMDALDQKFSRAIDLSYYNFSWPSITEALPFFVDSDRLYATDSMLQNVNVKKETLFVELKKTDKEIFVISNVSLQALSEGHDSECIIIKKSATEYRVVPVTQQQKSLLDKLLSISTFPLQAENMLTLFLAKLEDVMEVRSSLLSENAIPTIDSSVHIVAQMTRLNVGNYQAALRVKPVPGKQYAAMPGTGRRTILTTDEQGNNVRYRRDFDQERELLAQVAETIEGLEEEAEINDGDATAALSIEGVLALMAYAQANPEVLSIEWPVGQALKVKSASASSSWNVGIRSTAGGWFDLEGDVRIDQNTVLTMSTLLELVSSQKGQFVRMGDNEYLEIDRKLRKQLERLEALAVKNRNKLQISSFNAALLDEKVLDAEFQISADQKLVELQQRIRQSKDFEAPLPKKLNAELRPYQQEGFQWMARLAEWGAGACLADDMGLGKTVQTISFLLHKGGEGPALVVAPASVVPNWARELDRFAPSLDYVILNKAEDRTSAIKKAKKNSVVICTYGLLNTEEEQLCKKKWTTVCLDEAHTIKNRETKMSHAAMKLQADYRIILTGTPIQNHLGELWNLFRFINPGLLGSFDVFRQKFVKPITEENNKDRRTALQRIIKPFMLRRTKAEVIDDLPEKTEISLPVELSDEEMAMYEAMRQRAANALEGQTQVDINALAEITKLRQAACSMSLVNAEWQGTSSKVQAFMELVKEFKGDGSNGMLVFSQFTSFLDIVRKALDEAGEPYLYLDGSTTMKQREQLVADFAAGKCPIFLISLKAGGLGLNLPYANYVVHLDPWWNPAIEQQATDRAYRIGQKRNVTVYHLLAKNTIEEKIQRLHASKRDLADSLLQNTDMAGKLTMADVLALINS